MSGQAVEPWVYTRPPPTVWDGPLVVGAVAASYTTVLLAYLVRFHPVVKSLTIPLVVAAVGTVLITTLAYRRARTRRLARSWRMPILGLLVAAPLVAWRVTWALVPPAWALVLLAVALSTVIVHTALLYWSASYLKSDWRRALIGVLVVAISWTCIVWVPALIDVRRIRVELAAATLVTQAEALLDDPQPAGEQGAFIAVSTTGNTRVVGWRRGLGFLGNGKGWCGTPLESSRRVGTPRPPRATPGSSSAPSATP
jgi:hypothetical protein